MREIIKSTTLVKMTLEDLFKKDTQEQKWTRINKSFRTKLLNFKTISTILKHNTKVWKISTKDKL